MTSSNAVVRAFGAALVVSLLVASTLATSAPSAAAPSQAELDAAKERLHELVADVEIVIERYNLVHERLDAILATIGETELEVRAIERRMETKQDAAVALATELYKGGTTTSIEAVLSSESFADMDTRLVYLDSSERAQLKVFEELSVERQELDVKLDDLEVARAEAAATESRLAELRDEIESKIADQQDEVDRLSAAIERAERREAAAARAAAAAAAAVPNVAVNFSPPPAPSPAADTAVNAALSQVGKPYQWGAAGPNSYDCSGLTMWAWGQAGVSLPHNSGAQYSATPRVSQSDWAPGDLLFFGSPIHHVGMYVGRGQMVEAPYSGQSVRVVPAYRSDYVGAGRPGV